MSRERTSTDNPIIETLNGWMKEEPYADLDPAYCGNVPKLPEKYVRPFNELQLAVAPDYKSPIRDHANRASGNYSFSVSASA